MSTKNWSPHNKVPPASPARQSREENSGLIDLKAMMEQAEQDEKEANQALHVSQHIGVYPFGAPSSTPSPSVTQATQATLTPLATAAPIVEKVSFSSRSGRSSRQARLWGGILAGAIIGGSAVAAAAINARGLSQEPLQVAEGALASYVVERGWGPVRAQALAAEEKALQIKGTGTANAAGGQAPLAASAAPDRAAKVGQHVPKAPVMNRTPGTATPAAPAPAVTATPKPAAADPCKGDLMCAMQRAAAKTQGSPKK
jgi:hypothetical protein